MGENSGIQWTTHTFNGVPSSILSARLTLDVIFHQALQEPFRCYAHAADTRIVVRRPCSFVPKKWRAWRVSSKRMCPEGIPAHVWAQVLVALDAWLEGGCRVMRTPVLIREGSTP